MATIGLDSIYYATITEATTASTGVAIGDESFGTPAVLAKAIKADLTVETADGELYADDALCETSREFKSAKLSLGVEDIGHSVAAALTGATVDQNGVLVDRGEDNAPYVAIGFRAKKSNGAYRYYWLYRGKFAIPATNLETKGDGIKYNTRTIEGTFMRRNKADDGGKHPWKAEVDSDSASVETSTITGWFSSVYEPDFTA